MLFCHLWPGVVFGNDSFELGAVNMCVNLGCANIAMTKKFLNNTKVCAASEHVCRETVSKCMWVYLAKLSVFRKFANDLPNG